MKKIIFSLFAGIILLSLSVSYPTMAQGGGGWGGGSGGNGTDVAVMNITYLPVNPQVSQTVNASIVIQNVGNTSINVSHSVSVETPAGGSGGGGCCSNLEPGEFLNIITSFGVTTNGTYIISASVTAINLTDANLSNNIMTVNFTAGSTTSSGGSGSVGGFCGNSSISNGTNITVELFQGWNLIATPKLLDNDSIQNVTSGLNFSQILSYDNGQFVVPSTINPLKGYWIEMNENANLTLYFETSIIGPPPAVSLNEGWELIGFTDISSLPSECALFSIENSYSHWFGFDNENKFFFRHIFGGTPDIFMTLGSGYWLFMTQPDILAGLSV